MPLLAQLTAALAPAARTWLDQALAQATGAAEAAAAAEAAQPAPAAETVRPVPPVRPAQSAQSTASPEPHGPATPDATPQSAPRRLPAWELRFAEAGRRCGPQHADAARVLLLRAARADAAVTTRLYSQGTAAERRAVLLALPDLVPGPDALPLVEDALRTNDTRLVAAAVGPYAAAHLDAHAWRHAVLKCLFTGVPVDAVGELAERAHGDDELARMLGDYAQERRAAGRPVPEDLYRALDLTGVASSPEARPATEVRPATETRPAPPARTTTEPTPPAPAATPAPHTPTALKAPLTGEES